MIINLNYIENFNSLLLVTLIFAGRDKITNSLGFILKFLVFLKIPIISQRNRAISVRDLLKELEGNSKKIRIVRTLNSNQYKIIPQKAKLVCLFLLFTISVQGQSGFQHLNLISDPSAEDTTNIVNGWGATSLRQWHSLDTTDLMICPFTYFSYITQNSAYSLPVNQWCYQHPHSGGGILEFTFLWYNTLSWKRALARTKLKSKLIAGHTYLAKMYVNPCDKYYDTFTDGIAMYFDNGQLDTILNTDISGVYPFVQPQVSNPTGNILCDTLNWIPISGTFVANGTETFLTIGNFKTDSMTMRAYNPSVYDPLNPLNQSSLLIDDVSLIDIGANNWLHDTTLAYTQDSVYIGLPIYEMPDALWYDINMNQIGKGSGIKIKLKFGVAQYIQKVNVGGSSWICDTMNVFAYPLGSDDPQLQSIELEIYPNPASNGFNIKSNCKQDCAVVITVFNLNGEKIYNQPCDLSQGNCTVNKVLSPGSYMIHITNASTNNSIVKHLVIKK